MVESERPPLERPVSNANSLAPLVVSKMINASTQNLAEMEAFRRFVPAEQQTRILDPEVSAETLREAIGHLTRLQVAIKSFLPPYIAEDEKLLLQPYAALRAGAFLFADVSGFTAMSEQLQAQSGMEGTEVLTHVINEYFAVMLEILAKSEGQLLKFAGDALLAFFPSQKVDDVGASLKAVRTGLRMQRAMQAQFQPVRSAQVARLLGADHNATLTMSIGIARGELFEALVGNAWQRDHLVQGTLPGEAMAAEGAGDRDEVIVTGEIAEALRSRGELFQYRALEDGYQQVLDSGDALDDFELGLDMIRRRRSTAAGAHFDADREQLRETLAHELQVTAAVARYLSPPVLHELIYSDDYHLQSEKRPATTLFVHATGFAELLDEWGATHLLRIREMLERFYSIVQGIVMQYGGTLARIDPYKLGMKWLITFGAPVAHPDDPIRAVTTAFEIVHQTEQFNLRLLEETPEAQRHTPIVQVRVGVTQGEVYAGEVGWKSRREFTVMGDDVNLAARIMASADFGQALISERVYGRVQNYFAVQPVPPLILKGKRKPVKTFIVTGTLTPSATLTGDNDMPFVGHDMFLLSLGMALKQARGGKRRAIALVGDAGIGKTRIARQVIEMARASNFEVAYAACQVYTRHDPWAYLLHQLLHLPNNASEGRSALDSALANDKLSYLAPTLAAFLWDEAATADQQPEPPARAPIADIATPNAIADLYAMFQKMTPEERKSSGMFGVARRSTEAAAPNTHQQEGMFHQAARKTNVAHAVAQVLKTYSARTQTLIVLDDVHQASAQTQEILQTVLEEVEQGRLVLLLTCEPTTTLPAGLQTLNVPDLTQEETNRVALVLLRAGEVGTRLQTLLWEKTSGRPLFIESLLKLLLDREAIEMVNGRAELRAGAQVALPDNVRELVVSRIDRLTEDAQYLARAAAVLVDDFSAIELRAVSEMGERTFNNALGELLNAQLLTKADGGGEVIYNFRHGMTQLILYETLSRAQRLNLHQAAVKYYRSLAKTEAEPATLAHHLAKSGLLPQAVEVMTEAAEAAEGRGWVEEAITLYQHALTLLPDEKSVRAALERLGQPQTL